MPVRLSALSVCAVLLSAAAPAVNEDTLRLLAGELPYPQIDLGMSVGLASEDVRALELADPAATLAEAERRLAEDANDPAAHLRRAQALRALKREGAEAEFRQAEALWEPLAVAQPDNLEAQLGLAQAQAATDWAKAAPLAGDLAQKHPELWWPHYALGEAAARGVWALMDLDLRRLSQAPEPAKDQAAAAALGQLPPGAAASAGAALAGIAADPAAFVAAVRAAGEGAVAHLDRAAQAGPGEMAPRLEACLLSMQLALLGGIAGQAADLGPAHQRLDELSRLAEGHPAGMRPRLAASLVRIALAMAQYGGGRFVGVWDGLPAEVREALAVDEAAAAQFLEQESGRVPDAYELLAFYALLRGDVTAAAARLKEGTTHDPGSVELWHAYVGAVTGTQDTDAIRAAAEEALSSVKTGALYCTLAKAHHRRAEREQTEAALQAAVALGDKDAALAQLLLGLVRLKGGDAAGAIGPLQEACGQTRPEGLAETALALALALTGKQPEAAAQINQARTSDPANRLILRAAEVIGPAP